MNYTEIKRNLSAANRLVADGKLADAHRLVKAAAMGGATRHDIAYNLTIPTIRALRAWEKTRGGP